MWLGATAPESAVHFYPLTVISHGAISASLLVSELPDTLRLIIWVEEGGFLIKIYSLKILAIYSQDNPLFT